MVVAAVVEVACEQLGYFIVIVIVAGAGIEVVVAAVGGVPLTAVAG